MAKYSIKFVSSIFALFLLSSCIGETPVSHIPEEGYYKNEPVVFHGSYEEVWSASVSAVEQLDWEIKEKDELDGKIQLLTSYVYNPSFEEHKRVYSEPTNKEIKNSIMLPYLRKISYFEKITPPPAPPKPQFIKEKLKLTVTSISPSETSVKVDFKIMPYFDYKIGYLGTARSKGYVEKSIFNHIDETLTEAQLAKSEIPEPPPPPVSIGIGLELKDIFFDFNKSNIRPDAIPVLEQNAEILRENPEFDVVIQGYADMRGTVEYNLRLAQRRANTAKDFLVKLGIEPTRIVAVSKGKTTKFAAGTTEEAYQLNRRVHFLPLKPGTGTGALTTFKTND